MSKTTKFYNLRDRLNRYKKAVKDLFRSKYYTETSRSRNRNQIAENRIINSENTSKNA